MLKSGWGPYDPPYHDAPYFYWHPYQIVHYEYHVMWPGAGSGWADYLVALAGQMARDYAIDGVHLDSYGVHQLLADYHPDHPGGTNVGNFQAAAIQLVARVRAEMRQYMPEAVVILEGSSYQDMLDVCDGAQFESLPKLRTNIPYAWTEPRRYPIYTSSFEVAEMQEILDEGHNLALSPWWFDEGEEAVSAIKAMCVQAVGDFDKDGIPDDGDGSGTSGDAPCTNGQTADCDDNCPVIANGNQADEDGDGVGDACDACPWTIPGAQVDDTGCAEPVTGDFDEDGDVDQQDFGHLQACLTGDGYPQTDFACRDARLDADGDVDGYDLAILTGCMSGPNTPADPACRN